MTEKSTRAIIIFCVVLATVMQTLDSTIANVALSHIQGSLSCTQEQITWVLTSYIIAAAITIPLAGWLANCFGRKRILLASILGFMLTSVLCGLSENLPEIIIARFLQGVCGAGLIPLSQAVLLSMNTKENYGKAMAIWGFGVTIGPILGPILGGFLTENYNWRWVFYINLPVGLLALCGIYFCLSETKQQKRSFDFFGFISLSIAIGTFQLMLDRGSLQDWFSSTEIMIEALLASVFFYFFIVHTLTHKKPFLDLGLFQDRNYSLAVLLIFIMGIALFASIVLIPVMLQNQFHYPVTTAGVTTAVQGLGTMIAMLVVSRLIKKIDARYVIACGIIMIASALWQMSHYSLLMDREAFFLPGLMQGFGFGLAYISLSAIAFSTLSKVLQDEGAAFFNLMRNLGSSLGISTVETWLVHNTQIVHAALAENITPYHFHSTATALGLARLNATLNQHATMTAYQDDFYLIMCITLSILPLIFFLRKVVKVPQE
jgi:DHA2 family multidrug resistance protein